MRVELLVRDGAAVKDASRRGQGRPVDLADKTLLGDGEAVPVKFELPPMELGNHVLVLKVKAPPGSSNASDQYLESPVDVSEHQTHVLLVAGGPMRDYQYVRTLLFRDKSVKVDVLLQSGQPGMSQEATAILNDFPSTRQEMADYDCLVAFDPDWKALKPEQVKTLYDWVDQDHGGMIVVAGAVNAGRTSESWVQEPDLAMIRKLYPVEFNQGVSVSSNVTFSSEEPWPLEFTREGLQAAYLWLGDTAIASQAAWAQFTGVYSFCPVRDKKAGATVLARFSDPRTAGRPATNLHGSAALQCIAHPVPGQRRNVASAANRSHPVRPILDQDHSLRGPGAPPPPVGAGHALDRPRPLQRRRFGGGPGATAKLAHGTVGCPQRDALRHPRRHRSANRDDDP